MTPSERKVKEATGYKSSKVVEKQISEVEDLLTTLAKQIDHFEAFAKHIRNQIDTLQIHLNGLEIFLPPDTGWKKDVGIIRRLITGKRYEYMPLSPDERKELENRKLEIFFYKDRIKSLENEESVFGKTSVNIASVGKTISRIKHRRRQLTNKLDRLRADLNLVKTTEEAVWVEEEKQLKKQSKKEERQLNIQLRKEETIRTLRAIANMKGRKSRQIASYIKNQLRPQIAIMDMCPYCGNPFDDNPHADHIYPMSRGGLSMLSNMVIICSQCNIKKSDLTLNEFIERHAFDRDFIEANLKKLNKRF